MNENGLLELARNASGAGVWTLVVIAIITLIKGWPALRRLSIEADGSLRRDLFTRIRELEEELVTERRCSAQRLAELREESAEERRQCDLKLEELRAEVVGLHRQMATQQLSSAETIARLPPATADAVLRQSQRDETNEPS